MATYSYPTNAIEDAGLEAALADPANNFPEGYTAEQLVAQMLKVDLATTAVKYQATILGKALAAYPAASDANKEIVLGKLGLSAYAALPVEALLPILEVQGAEAFMKLSGADQSAVFSALGI